ncbi:periphilin-1-like isoform X2 [Boleophthalmus pectinirostris]|uniref:periphilin-1-like isoform X2 n=1 Tax=Boleophthalmus pectinirostris TaxID=150288 RepID=UPI000A1C4230|nr:periphilin-1-like isoform X2 [Boleophthalmus pectinirostris]
MFQRGRKNFREAYDNHFMSGPRNGREVTFHRVVNVVERRNPMQMMGGDFDRRGLDGPLYNEPMPYQDPRECQGSNNYPQNDAQFFENEDHRFGNFHRNAPPPRNEGHYNHNRDDLRHHLDSRNNGRGGNFFRNRGRDPAREDIDYRRREQFTFVRDRSPVRRGNHSSNSASRPSEKSSSQQKPKPTASASPPHGSPEEDLPQTPTTSKESPPASVAEPEEEVEAASVEPEPTPEQDLKARRVEAIKAKALEIEKDYRQDCETFRTVVKMLVDKEPSLDYLLQAPLEKNLEEIKERCLDSLKQFIKELDEAIEQPSNILTNTDQPTEG